LRYEWPLFGNGFGGSVSFVACHNTYQLIMTRRAVNVEQRNRSARIGAMVISQQQPPLALNCGCVVYVEIRIFHAPGSRS
jgi:hypothetical protein